MKGEQIRYIHALERFIVPKGFKQSFFGEYSVSYENDRGWIIRVDSDKYYEGVFRWIVAPDGFYYSVFPLIQTYEAVCGIRMQLKQEHDWIVFISENLNWICQVPQPFKELYRTFE